MSPNTGYPGPQAIEFLESLGVNSEKIKDVSRRPKATTVLDDMIAANDLVKQKPSSHQGSLLASLAISGVDLNQPLRAHIVKDVMNGRICSHQQIIGATEYFEKGGLYEDTANYQMACGAGVVVSKDQIRETIQSYIEDHKEQLSLLKWNGMRQTLSDLKGSDKLKWANFGVVKEETEAFFAEMWGPKNGRAPTATKNVNKFQPFAEVPCMFEDGFLGGLHKPGEIEQAEPHLMEEHLAATGGKVITRFPPEPNGFLLTRSLEGHAKAIEVNFGFAKYHGGECNLRYDDTNPEVEEQKYYDSILETVRWLGYEPDRITYASDYFQRLYDTAKELIRRDKAYVCQCTRAELHVDRGGEKGDLGPRKACKHRNRPVSESLELFGQMQGGLLGESEAILRMKQDLDDPNPQMWDITAYRIRLTPHVRTGTKWKVYPTYDFTHCLCDSFENITHSLCTTEFVTSRQSYEWLCHALGVYTPRQSEYGRLNLTHTVLSKRKLLPLVHGGHVTGWDDPRLYTLIALRRRGVPPGAIRAFVKSLGVTTATTNTSTIRLEQSIRQYLESRTPRLMFVLRPVKVTIENLPEDFVLMIDRPLHPKDPTMGNTTVPFTRTVYIDSLDFRTESSKDYFRLTPGKSVGLLHVPHPITCTAFTTDPVTGAVVHIICHYDHSEVPVKPKAFVQWVAEHPPMQSPILVDQTRIFKPLFNCENPSAGQSLLDTINKDSLEVVAGALLEVGFWSVAKEATNAAKDESIASFNAKPLQPRGNECVRFQGLRTAYFALDSDAVVFRDGAQIVPGPYAGKDRIVLNQIVLLKEDARMAI
ncbi:glutaminyl-tRNA synthetase [Rickenella mellea]|uniref:glutamine--tRNA ligase n=1 Tax=Rickenella mellea TaxID=50990 RepID=A0A4Y7QEZ1_9AGAM|nr:glutaminyl-tRNA synthetase [Rickenella mellea]